jgi:hypothetical protein
VTTIKGVNGEVAEAVQKAWIKFDVPQCGYCQTGQIMQAMGLLSENRKLTDDGLDAAARQFVRQWPTRSTPRRASAWAFFPSRGLRGLEQPAPEPTR